MYFNIYFIFLYIYIHIFVNISLLYLNGNKKSFPKTPNFEKVENKNHEVIKQHIIYQISIIHIYIFDFGVEKYL